MKTEKIIRALANLKILMVMLVFAAAVVALFSCGKNKSKETAKTEIAPPPPPMPIEEVTGESKEVPFTVVDEMPQFSGGQQALFEYLSENTKYPAAAKEKNIQGKVIVKFCVTATGGISQVEILKGVSPELDAEAIRVVKALPSFIPGKMEGKAVPVWYSLPISYKLN